MSKYDFDLSLIGGRIKYCRIRKGLTQREVAKKLGVSTKQYIHYEQGSCGINSYLVAELSKILKVSTDYLLLGGNKYE